MADKIVDGETYDWSTERTGGGRTAKGYTKYLHLLDGKARELDIYDYGHTNPVNFLIALRRVARVHGLAAKTKVVDDHTVAFQITGRRK
jgi:hypothetical protein